MRWDDDLEDKSPSNSIIKKPKFHLLIPANIPTANLCKTLLSAAILNYPPPTLVSYGATEGNNRAGVGVVRRTFSFLLGKEVHDDDLILVLEDGTHSQSLRGDILTICRYLVTTTRRSNHQSVFPWYARHECKIVR